MQNIMVLNLAPIIGDRWSPRAFDPERSVEPEKIHLALTAAQWAPSSGNLQPWSFIVGANFDACHRKILSTLKDGNSIWARNAPVLILTVAELHMNGQPNRFAFHDVGLATQNLLSQVTALGLVGHFMGGFFPEVATEIFHIPDGFEPVAVGAIGYGGREDLLSDDLKSRETRTRRRKNLGTFAFSETWGTPIKLPPVDFVK